MSFSRVPNPCSKIQDALQSEPDGLDTRFTVALASKETTETRDRADYLTQRRCRFRYRFLGQNLGGLPFIGLEQQLRNPLGRLNVTFGGGKASSKAATPRIDYCGFELKK